MVLSQFLGGSLTPLEHSETLSCHFPFFFLTRHDFSGVSMIHRGSVPCTVWLYNATAGAGWCGAVQSWLLSQDSLTLIARSASLRSVSSTHSKLWTPGAYNWIQHLFGIWTPFNLDLFSFIVLVGVWFFFFQHDSFSFLSPRKLEVTWCGI